MKLLPSFDPCSVYVGNVDLQASNQELADHFQTTGEVVRVTILKNKKTGRPKSAAYIQFKDSWSVEGALCMEGSNLRGRQLIVRRKRMLGQ